MNGRDRILTADIAAALQADAIAESEMVARPVTAGRGALAYVLVADPLPRLCAPLPARLARMLRTPAEPEGVIEVWCGAEARRSCPPAWCRSGAPGRGGPSGQAARGGRLTMGSSPSGAMDSSVM